MKICIAYDCLYPWTVGGAERWYRSLAERLAADGHTVTYLTRLQWDPAEPPAIPGVRVIAVSKEEPLYGPDGNRRIGEALRYGWGTFLHLTLHGRSYDVVHTCSFPYFSLLGAACVRPFARYGLVVDWFEVWSGDYWRGYLGGARGRVGHLVQRLCARVPQRANCFSRRHAGRLDDEGMKTAPTLVGGLYYGPREASDPFPGPLSRKVLSVGRQIAEKHAPRVVEAIGEARSRGLDVEGLVVGDGPEHEAVVRTIERLGLEDSVSAPTFLEQDELDAAMSTALCLLHPSKREGYGMVVIEAASRGTPSVVVEHPDNASAEVIQAGVNGLVARSASPADLADAIAEVAEAGPQLRASTIEWFRENFDRLSLDETVTAVVASYSGAGRSA